eukprot:517102-Amphidinium_carterae.1
MDTVNEMRPESSVTSTAQGRDFAAEEAVAEKGHGHSLSSLIPIRSSHLPWQAQRLCMPFVDFNPISSQSNISPNYHSAAKHTKTFAFHELAHSIRGQQSDIINI